MSRPFGAGVMVVAIIVAGCGLARAEVVMGPEPAGTRVSIERAEISDDGRVLQLHTTGWAPYQADDPCSAAYAGWATQEGDALAASIVETIAPRTRACNLLGYPVDLTVPLPQPHERAELTDLTGGTVLLRTPDTLARFEGVPDGWELRRDERYRSNEESGRHESVDRTWSAEPLPQEYGPTGLLQLTQVFGGPSLIRGEGRIEPITINGTVAAAEVDGWYGEVILAWMLEGDGFALIANEADFTLDQLITMAESVRHPPA